MNLFYIAALFDGVECKCKGDKTILPKTTAHLFRSVMSEIRRLYEKFPKGFEGWQEEKKAKEAMVESLDLETMPV